MAASSGRAPQLLYLLGIMFSAEGEEAYLLFEAKNRNGTPLRWSIQEGKKKLVKTRAVEITNLTTSNLCYRSPTITRTEQRVYRSLCKPPAAPRRNKWRFVISPNRIRD